MAGIPGVDIGVPGIERIGAVVRLQDGEYPSFGRLLAGWLLHAYLPLGNWGGAGPDYVDDYSLPAVRRRDMARVSST
ncbi:hypothetical protein [Nocardia sp. NPDC057030]|uniref:hypothetical protein n=1 Tax=unclassified Nocardia TaxID=2637762 RepID=UPI003627693D